METHVTTTNPRLRLLFVDHGATLSHKLQANHSHPYWQLEIVVQGAGALELGDHPSMPLVAGDLVFVPAWVRHRFNYFRKAKESWSFKFDVESESPGRPALIRGDSEGDVAKEALLKLGTSEIDLLQSELAQGIIDALREKSFRPRHVPGSSAAELTDHVRTLVRRDERIHVDVAYLAQELGYSRNYFSTFFKKQTGVSPKRLIDQERIEIARRHLRYSNRSIAEIAGRMGFADAFTFSHFFKRVTGVSPSTFRTQDVRGR